MKSNKSALIALLLVQLFYGVTFTFANDVIDGGFIQPYGFILFRVSLAGLLFWGFSIWTPSEKIDRKDLPKFIMAAFFGVALNMLASLTPARLTTPAPPARRSTPTRQTSPAMAGRKAAA